MGRRERDGKFKVTIETKISRQDFKCEGEGATEEEAHCAALRRLAEAFTGQMQSAQCDVIKAQDQANAWQAELAGLVDDQPLDDEEEKRSCQT